MTSSPTATSALRSDPSEANSAGGHGSAVSDATDGRCAACQMMLRPQFFQDLKRGDSILQCESCGRILYYNPPVNLEHEMHQNV